MPRVCLHVRGIVQGVGFRPFVFQRATALGLSGWVKNGKSGVEIEVQGFEEAIETFVRALEVDLPRPGRVFSIARTEAREDAAAEGFSILPSDEREKPAPLVPPDLSVCAACLAESLAPSGRRSGYAFTCCARCGPRYSIIEALPYDRARTSMRVFPRCDDCRREYEDVSDRRFHAEPIACPQCGPRLSLLSPAGERLAEQAEALSLAARELKNGKIVALRGLGGFQLLVDATSPAAVIELRRRKEREEKPFAVLVRDIEAALREALLSEVEIAALTGPEAPIVLARKKLDSTLAEEVAPNNPLVGLLLPATPLHHLLALTVGKPLVCTSGNISGEPLCTDTDEALARLGAIADSFLTHDRPIVRPVDDSVVREGPRQTLTVLRRARGFSPLSVGKLEDTRSILGLGAFLKSTVTLSARGELVTSQHLGDMDDPASIDLLERTARDMCRFFDVRPEIIACDLHPDFASTRLAERLATECGARLVRVQHHHAHIAAVMAEHGLEGEVLGLAWDGYGFGADGQAWGGEALVVSDEGARRVAHLAPFRLPGGDRAAREPRRSALGLLVATLGPTRAFAEMNDLFDAPQANALCAAITSGFSAPETTSVGRLFDAVAALAGLRGKCSFEGQAAMELEWAAETNLSLVEPFPLPLSNDTPAVADLVPLAEALLADRAAGLGAPHLAARLQNTLVELAWKIAERAGLPHVALAGGCFQNVFLARATRERLERAGFSVLAPAAVPVNDGGISVGQVLVASRAPIGQR